MKSPMTLVYDLIEEKIMHQLILPNEPIQLISRLSEDNRVSIMGCEKEMKLVKNVGLVKDLDKKYDIKSMKGISWYWTFENSNKQ